ncbi:hypothetical protein [Paucibacter sp. DJ2R-2]|uniref:hypothetical protein n=1 Tax=Paucibacter sp. DJ2R-2 TaxID=2893558 RepID=UPI0021E4C6A5|nr:hypothetical protein [Paucibacter sp. DJ2R-2]MCV2438619.1 hypothetical protein [Paucibacter sp. DJ2R-2]
MQKYRLVEVFGSTAHDRRSSSTTLSLSRCALQFRSTMRRRTGLTESEALSIAAVTDAAFGLNLLLLVWNSRVFEDKNVEVAQLQKNA